MTWVITALAMLGTVLNILRLRWCFVVWIITNGYWAVYDWSIGATAQAVLFAVYFALAVWGLVRWSQSR